MTTRQASSGELRGLSKSSESFPQKVGSENSGPPILAFKVPQNISLEERDQPASAKPPRRRQKLSQQPIFQLSDRRQGSQKLEPA